MKKYSMVILFMFALLTLTSSVCYSVETGTITGKVVDSKSGEGIAGVDISIYAKKSKLHVTTTDKQGQFLLKDVLPDKYPIHATGYGYYPNITNTVNCVANQTTSINLKLRRYNYSLSGRVSDVNADAPIEGARVIIVEGKFSGEGRVTDYHGKFDFPDMPKGVYTVKILADGYEVKYLTDIIHQPEKEKAYSILLEPIPEIITQTFPVKYLPVHEMVKRITAMISKEGSAIVGSDSLIVTDTKVNLEKIGDVIAQLDAPPIQVQLEVKLLLASSEKENKSAIPKELDNIAKQLKTLFRYKNYELLDDARFMALENEGGEFLIGKGEYKTRINRIDFIDINGGLIKLERFELLGKKGIEKDYMRIFDTTVNIPNGDTVILGASNVDASGKALIIAVTAKTIEKR